jgi:uncharacterized protein YdaT
MPWDEKSFKTKHNKSLTPKKAGKAAKIANAILKKTGDEGKAIAIANAKVKKK